MLIAAGFLVAVGGKVLGNSVIISFGVGIVALDVALLGLEGVVTRRVKWGITQHYYETYQGLAATSLGIIMMIAGIGVGAIVVAEAIHQEQFLFEILWSHPWFILLMIGGMLFLRGLAGTIGAQEWNKTLSSRISGIFERLGSAFLGILGITGLILGTLNLLAPAAFHQLMSSLWQMILGLFSL